MPDDDEISDDTIFYDELPPLPTPEPLPRALAKKEEPAPESSDDEEPFDPHACHWPW